MQQFCSFSTIDSEDAEQRPAGATRGIAAFYSVSGHRYYRVASDTCLPEYPGLRARDPGQRLLMRKGGVA